MVVADRLASKQAGGGGAAAPGLQLDAVVARFWPDAGVSAWGLIWSVSGPGVCAGWLHVAVFAGWGIAAAVSLGLLSALIPT